MYSGVIPRGTELYLQVDAHLKAIRLTQDLHPDDAFVHFRYVVPPSGSQQALTRRFISSYVDPLIVI